MDQDNEVSGNALTVRHEFGVTEKTMGVVETASSAAAARAKAIVEARYTVAMHRPRNLDQVRIDLLAECRRPAFAHNKSALYNKPIGKGVEGLGIRFVEVALRCMRNVLIESEMVFEDETKEVHRVTVTDLESNTPWSGDVRVSKTVERSKALDDGSYISVRKNSYGKDVFTVPANDDDLLNKRAALISKAIRTLGLRIIPGDFQDEAEDIIRAIRLDKAAKDPAGERKKIADAFAEMNVRVTDLEAYLGHKLDSCSPAEIVKLRGIYGAIRDGEATWKSVMESVKPEGSEPPEPGKTATGRKKPTAKPKPYKFISSHGERLFEQEMVDVKVGERYAIDGVDHRVVEVDFETHHVIVEPSVAVAATGDPQARPKITGSMKAGGEPAVAALATQLHIDQIKKKLVAFEITETELCKAFSMKAIGELKLALVPAALAWIGDPASKPDLGGGKE